MKEKVLVVAPTTASRLPLLKEVLGKLYDNTNLDIKTNTINMSIKLLTKDYFSRTTFLSPMIGFHVNVAP